MVKLFVQVQIRQLTETLVIDSFSLYQQPSDYFLIKVAYHSGILCKFGESDRLLKL